MGGDPCAMQHSSRQLSVKMWHNLRFGLNHSFLFLSQPARIPNNRTIPAISNNNITIFTSLSPNTYSFLTIVQQSLGLFVNLLAENTGDRIKKTLLVIRLWCPATTREGCSCWHNWINYQGQSWSLVVILIFQMFCVALLWRLTSSPLLCFSSCSACFCKGYSSWYTSTADNLIYTHPTSECIRSRLDKNDSE